MADSSGCKTCSIANSNIQLSVKPSDICCICEGLKSELHKAQLEISYEKVIQVLREELYNVVLRTQPDSRKQSDYHAEQHGGYNSKDDWTQVTMSLTL